MSNELLIHATGLDALALNVVALVCTCERTLRVRSGIAGMAWALNNFLMGANVAAALSVLSASRTATSAITLGARRSRAIAFATFAALTLVVGLLTWGGWASLLLMAGAKGKRYALPNSRVMIHQPSGGAQGQATDIEIQAREILYLRGRLNGIYVKHTGQALEQVERDMERDRFMSGEDAKTYGLIDAVLEKRPGEAAQVA
jgi:hypothetical protein